MFSRETEPVGEIYIDKIYYMTMEAEKSHNLSSAGWNPGKPVVWFEGLRAEGRCIALAKKFIWGFP